MENKILNITLNDLLNIYEINYSEKPKKDLLKNNLEIINKFNNFYLFLENNNFDYYELPYILYGQIIYYMKYCYDNGDFDEIRKMLEFIDNKLQSKNEYVNTLAQIGVLENFDIYPDILPKILELMPQYSKDIFMKHYSHYIK